MDSHGISPQLRRLVSQSVALLGETIRENLGNAAFARIEATRREMAAIRNASDNRAARVLTEQLRMLKKLSKQERAEFARAYTMMLELMNACENAYRSHRLKASYSAPATDSRPDSIIYVLTAHPTEARSPESIWVFHQIQQVLTEALGSAGLSDDLKKSLTHWLEVAWRTPLVRQRKPRVHDEAEHVYSTLLRDESLRPLLAAARECAPVYVRSWVGGDKDGHPGVDEKVFLDSLGLSRRMLCAFVKKRLTAVFDAIHAMEASRELNALKSLCHASERSLAACRVVGHGDAKNVVRLRASLRALATGYERMLGSAHPELVELKQLMKMFPAFVVPIEFRESSDVLVGSPEGQGLAIARMLKALALVSRGGDPRWYVRGFIVSMTGSIEHLQLAAGLTRRCLGGLKLPIIPLFEQAQALQDSELIVSQMLKDPVMRAALGKYWGGFLEVMVGYSDSSKESGVLFSRIEIARNMHKLDRFCRSKHVTPLFFQGSGGSIDRGGGTVQEQTAWWPSGALRNYKVTLQGEMVERSLASPEITRGQIEKITESAGLWKQALKKSRSLRETEVDRFALVVAKHYRAKIRAADFLLAVERGTPYRFLDLLKIGSRPAKRSTAVSVGSLRAIPWVLCWTQTRVLFQTWWGVGSAWHETSPRERAQLVRAYRNDPAFATFVRALSFTLAKVELGIWRVYLDESGLPEALIERIWKEFTDERDASLKFVQAMLKSRSLLAWKPWLEESIELRSAMIHPLNLLQILALKDRDAELLRLTVLGVSSGMMTTG